MTGIHLNLDAWLVLAILAVAAIGVVLYRRTP